MGIIKEGSDNFPKKQKVLLDTNVLYWLTYASSRVFPRTLSPQKYQLEVYPRIFEKLLENENILYFSNYSISELTSIIARIESSLDGCSQSYQRKKWLRKDGRALVLKELKVVKETMESWAMPLDRHDHLDTSGYITRYGQVYLDGYDIYIEHEINKNNIKYMLTDDVDFSSVGGLNIITANRSV
jgi:hypothetical protein